MNRKFSFLVLFILVLQCNNRIQAQVLNFAWANSIQSSEAFSVATDDTGNVYVTGFFTGTTDLDPGPDSAIYSTGNKYKVYIVKYNSSGYFVWGKVIGGTSSVFSICIKIDHSGSIYVCGSFKGTIDFNPDSGVYNISASLSAASSFILKLNNSGNYVWAQAFITNSGGGAYCKSIDIDNDGNVYSTGDFSDTTDFDPGVGVYNLTSGTFDPTGFISKLDSAGHFVWARKFNGVDNFSNCIRLNSYGKIGVCGNFFNNIFFSSTGGPITLNASSSAIFVATFDTAGNCLWGRAMGGTDYNHCSSIDSDLDGNFLTTGNFLGVADFDPGTGVFNLTATIGSNSDEDIFISKLDSNGNFVWAKSIHGSLDDNGNFLIVDRNSNVYTTGFFSDTADFDPGPTSHYQTASSSKDVFILKLDSSGNFDWVMTPGGLGTENGHGMAMDTSDNLIVVGRFQSSIRLGIDTLTNIGLWGAFVTKLSCISFDTISAIACVSYVSPSGNYVWTTSGIYKDTIPSGPGCFIVRTVNLTINSINTFSTQSVIACDGYISPSGKFTWLISGTYNDTIPNAATCDSIITINLTINNSSSSTQTVVQCDPYTSPSGNYVWGSSGIYLDTLVNSTGCDSIIITHLTIQSSTSILNISICDGDSLISPSGLYVWTSTGFYQEVIPNYLGCDSLINVHLTVIDLDNSVVQNGNTFYSVLVNAIYQWLDCDNNYAPINGANNQAFTPLVNGNYAVYLSDLGCIDTSYCYHITLTNVNQINAAAILEIIPNPVIESCIIKASGFDSATLIFYDLQGRTLREQPFRNQEMLEIDWLPQGTYFVEIVDNDYNKAVRKLVKL